MIVKRPFYFLHRAIDNLRLNPFATGMNVFTLTTSLIMLGVFFLLASAFETAVPSWMMDVRAVVYLKAGVPDSKATELAARVRKWPEVKAVRFVSGEEAWQRLKVRLSEWRDIFDGFEENPLPSSLEITFQSSLNPDTGLDSIIQHLKRLPEVESVQSGRLWMEKFDSFLKLMRFVGSAVMLLVSAVTVIVVSNTIKLTVFARREELEIYGIVGASPWFTKAPFYLEAVLQGLISAFLAIWPLKLLVYLTHRSLPDPLSNVLSWSGLHSTSLSLTLILAGALLGWAGSWLALRRFLRF